MNHAGSASLGPVLLMEIQTSMDWFVEAPDAGCSGALAPDTLRRNTEGWLCLKCSHVSIQLAPPAEARKYIHPPINPRLSKYFWES